MKKEFPKLDTTNNKLKYLSDPEMICEYGYTTMIRRLTIADREIVLPANFVSIVNNQIYSGVNYLPIDKLVKAIDEHKNFSATIFNLDCRLLNSDNDADQKLRSELYHLPYRKEDEFLAGISSVIRLVYDDGKANYYNISYVYGDLDYISGDTVYVDWRWFPDRL